MIEIIAPADRLFIPGWIKSLNLHRRNTVPTALRAEGRYVGVRCYNLLRVINTLGVDSEIDCILTATRFFDVNGRLTRKGRDFQDSSLDYLTFCCNIIRPFVDEKHRARWQEVRNALFESIVPQDIQRSLNDLGQGFDRWE